MYQNTRISSCCCSWLRRSHSRRRRRIFLSAPGSGSSQDLARIIFRPGFSTSPGVTHLSGRGMGLSVVYEAVRRLQGEVDLRQKAGPGASFLLSVPLSVSTCHLLLVSSQGQTFGIPTHGVERLYRVGLRQIETVEGRPVANLDGGGSHCSAWRIC